MAIVSVFGGSGFLGLRVVQHLASAGMAVRVAVRQPDGARRVLRAAGLDQVTVLRADVRDRASVADALGGAEAAVNAVSAFVDKDGVTFEAVYEHGARTLAQEAVGAGVGCLVHVSGIGADAASDCAYIRARGRGERVVQEAFSEATIVRPGAMFGPGDALFGGVARFARRFPVLPLIGGGHTRLQPVYVEDVAEAIARVVANRRRAGRIYELGGPRAYTLRELFEFVSRLMGRRCVLVPIPFAVAELQARLFEFLPNPPLTMAQVGLLRADNVPSGTLPGLRELDIEPKAVEEVVPT